MAVLFKYSLSSHLMCCHLHVYLTIDYTLIFLLYSLKISGVVQRYVGIMVPQDGHLQDGHLQVN